MSALAELERLQGAVGPQRERVAELDRARADAARRVEWARARLLDFYRERERAGGQVGDADDVGNVVAGDHIVVELPESERALIEELREVEGGLSVRADVIPYGAGMMDVQLASVDPRAEAAWEGAMEALAERERELADFVRENLPALAAGRAPMAREVQERAVRALEEARRVAADHERERTWWARTLSLADMEGLLLEIPDNELAWSSRAGTPALPMPERFIG